MKKLIYSAAMAIMSASAAFAGEWDVQDLNDHIDQTNYIVENHCSATLISLEHRLILTNEHCIDQAVRYETRSVVDDKGFVQERRVQVRKPVTVKQNLYDAHELISSNSYVTDIVDFSEEWDLALLQLRSEKIPNTRYAHLFNGEKVYRGEVAYAIGNPMMLDATVTKGIISNVNRKLQVGGKFFPYYQMDVGIEGGSSGGSLYNERGELIGVPAAAARGTSVALAIPYTFVQRLLDRNCYQEVYDAEAESYEECMAVEEDEEAEASE